MQDDLLYIFVEGDDDARFFERILVPLLARKNKIAKVIKYAQKPDKLAWVGKYAKSIEAQGADWVVVTDLDRAPCATARKEQISAALKRVGVKLPRVAVVVKMIESWYVAGLTKEAWKELGIRGRMPRSDSVGKEQFNRLIPSRFDSRIDFMLEVLKRFTTEEAKKKNRSFGYWLEKYDC